MRSLLAIVAPLAAVSLVTAAQTGTSVAGGAGAIAVAARPIPLNPQNPAEVVVGNFTFAGGLALTSATGQLHALSDLEVSATGQLTAVSDLGTLFEARILLDDRDRLVGLADGRLTPLLGEDGRPLAGRSESDAEGLAILPSGDRLVSFEGRSRILLYPADGGVPRLAPMPSATFAQNAGMEALAADPDVGTDGYVVGSEFSGETWTCRVSQSECVKGPTALKTIFFGLVAMRRLPDGQTAYLLRTIDQQRRYRVILKVVRDRMELANLELAAPMNTENFEGLAALPRADGSVRFYLVSDDNASPRERTLLFAFDWRPAQ